MNPASSSSHIIDRYRITEHDAAHKRGGHPQQWESGARFKIEKQQKTNLLIKLRAKPKPMVSKQADWLTRSNQRDQQTRTSSLSLSHHLVDRPHRRTYNSTPNFETHQTLPITNPVSPSRTTPHHTLPGYPPPPTPAPHPTPHNLSRSRHGHGHGHRHGHHNDRLPSRPRLARDLH